MPATVASWSTSSVAGGTCGCSAASMYWRTLEVRDRWMKASPCRSAGTGSGPCARRCPAGSTRWKPSVQKGCACSSGVSARTAASARSASPRCTRSMQGSDSTSATDSVMPGHFARNPASTCGSQPAASEGSSATATRPRSRAASSLRPSSADSNSSSRRCALGRKAAPSGVRTTCRVLRSKRRRPTCSSSPRMSAEKAGCERWQAAAARVKLALSARVRKARSWRVESSVMAERLFICLFDQSIRDFHFTNESARSRVDAMTTGPSTR